MYYPFEDEAKCESVSESKEPTPEIKTYLDLANWSVKLSAWT